MPELGYVVVEFNQASGQPRLASDDVYRDRDEADVALEAAEAETRRYGRRERYVVAKLHTEED